MSYRNYYMLVFNQLNVVCIDLAKLLIGFTNSLLQLLEVTGQD